ncbi:cupin domain-containing protein [Sedimentitalea sp. HM32M-2]|uniref:cupin domain-containing protein n=1 Tax=Sedimentitalea sp. HM32M-2 TaxID=3351566 RepID=UPI00363B873A
MTRPVIDFQIPTTTTKRRLSDLPDRVVAGDPHHETQMQYTSPDGTLLAGTWISTPGKWHAFADRDEFCVILTGHVRLIAADGTAQEFRAGDSFLIPNGFEGYWEVLETTTKHFVIRDYSA